MRAHARWQSAIFVIWIAWQRIRIITQMCLILGLRRDVLEVGRNRMMMLRRRWRIAAGMIERRGNVRRWRELLYAHTELLVHQHLLILMSRVRWRQVEAFNRAAMERGGLTILKVVVTALSVDAVKSSSGCGGDRRILELWRGIYAVVKLHITSTASATTHVSIIVRLEWIHRANRLHDHRRLWNAYFILRLQLLAIFISHWSSSKTTQQTRDSMKKFHKSFQVFTLSSETSIEPRCDARCSDKILIL